MTKIVADSELKSRLHGCRELVELCDESGQTLGYFHPIHERPQTSGIESPFSVEELERREQESGGSTLDEILRGLGAA